MTNKELEACIKNRVVAREVVRMQEDGTFTLDMYDKDGEFIFSKPFTDYADAAMNGYLDKTMGVVTHGNTQHVPILHPNTPNKAQERKATPVFSGVLDYFPDAIRAVAQCSYKGNEQHNPGKPLHWDRTKSQDHADCIVRHLLEKGTIDDDGIRHSAKVAWRALAMLQLEIEASKK